MDSIAYSAMLEQIDKGAYTEITAKKHNCQSLRPAATDDSRVHRLNG